MCNFIKADSTACKLAPSKKFSNGFCHRHQPIIEEPVIVEEPIIEEPFIEEEPVVVEPIIEEIVSEIVSERPVVEEPVIEEPVIEEKPVVEEPVIEEKPVIEEPVIEEKPVVEEILSETESSGDDIDELARADAASKIKQCADYLKEHSDGVKYHIEYRLKQKDVNEYMHPVREHTVMRIEFADNQRRFYWIPSRNPELVHQFNQHIGLGLKLEAHDIICAPRCRMFFDIDMKLDDMELDELSGHYGLTLTDDNAIHCMDNIGMSLMEAYVAALKLSLEEHGVDSDDLECIDWMGTQRNRCIDGGYKLSSHIITNLMLPVELCKAIADDIKDNTIQGNAEALGLTDDIVSLVVDAVDSVPYGHHKSLGMPYGVKHGQHMSWITREYGTAGQSYLLTHSDIYTIDDMVPSGYTVHSTRASSVSSPEFVQRALAHVSSIPGWSNDVWSANPDSLRGAYIQARRARPSHCDVCERTHDNDNTLKLIFDSLSGIASWKCIRSKTKARVFYREDPDFDTADLDAFVERVSTPKAVESVEHDTDDLDAFSKKAASRKTPSVDIDADVEDPEDSTPRAKSKSKSKAPRHIVTYHKFSRLYSGVPPMFDKKHESSFFDAIKLKKGPMLMSTAYNFICNNVAYVFNGGNSYYFTKSRNEHGEITYNYLKEFSKKTVDINFSVDDSDTTGTEPLNRTSIKVVALSKLVSTYLDDITYDRVDFLPFNAKSGQYIKKMPNRVYTWNQKSVFNQFTGLVHNYESKFQVDETRFKTFLKHLREGWCNDDEALYQYTLKMFAWYVQKPYAKSGSCLVVESDEGAGKNIISSILANEILGAKYCLETPSMKKLTGRFNHAREAKLLVVLNEAASASQTAAADQEVLKDVITEDHVVIERKGIDPYRVACRANVIIFSNNSYSVKASNRLRRFVFYKMSNRFIGDQSHFDQIIAEFEEQEAGKHLYHYLMNIDIDTFHPQNDAPLTEAKVEMRKMAIDKPVKFLIDWLNGDYIPRNQDDGKPTQLDDVRHAISSDSTFIDIDMMYYDFNKWLSLNKDNSLYTRDRFSKALTKLLGVSQRKRIEQIGRLRGYTVSADSLKATITAYTSHNDLFDIEE
jgi:hypothetical protein